MISQPLEVPHWSRARWMLSIAFLLAVQTALIVSLERHSSAVKSKPVSTPLVHLRENVRLEQFLVSDPTVFVLPNAHGFSGEAWLNEPRSPDFELADWTEPMRALAFTTGASGGGVGEFLPPNPIANFKTVSSLVPLQSVPSLFAIEIQPVKTTLRIDGGLAARRMLNTPALPDFASPELLAATVVQVLVDAQGRVVSAVNLAPAATVPNQQQADAVALDLAKSILFEPAPNGRLMFGNLVFEWQTLPMPGTNQPGPIP